MDEPLLILLIITVFITIPFVFLGRFFRSNKSHQFINRKEKISNITAYANLTGNSMYATGIFEWSIALAFYLDIINLQIFELLSVIFGFIPLPCVLYAHLRYVFMSTSKTPQ
jgi:hypothetical protein